MATQAVGWDRRVTVWQDEWRNRQGQLQVKALYSLRGHRDDIGCIALNRETLATGDDNGDLKVRSTLRHPIIIIIMSSSSSSSSSSMMVIIVIVIMSWMIAAAHHHFPVEMSKW